MLRSPNHAHRARCSPALLTLGTTFLLVAACEHGTGSDELGSISQAARNEPIEEREPVVTKPPKTKPPVVKPPPAEPPPPVVEQPWRPPFVAVPSEPPLLADPGPSQPQPVAQVPWTDPVGSKTSDETVQGERWVKKIAIGVAPVGYTCPPLPTPEDPDSGWVGGKMFGDRPAGELLDEHGGIFCRYDYNGPADSFSWAGLPGQTLPCGEGNQICTGGYRGAQWLHPDARVASEQAPGLLGQMQARLRVEYLAQMQAPLALPPVVGTKVDLAILDSLVDSTAAQVLPLPGVGHGRAMGMAAFRLACPGGATSCPINLRFYQAFEPNTVASLSELAVKFVKSTDDAIASGAHRVQNASLGMHPLLAWWDEPGTNPDFPAGVMLPAFRAVKAALNYASKHGVITVAAAGNTDGSIVNTGDEHDGELLYPAAFDGQDGWTCNQNRECTPESRSLVLAAGGVTADNQPLPNARFSGHPVPFVAPACNVALDNQLPWETTQSDLPTYCGTSFGAIGVSTVLAATWSYMPNASAEQVIQTVRSAGINLNNGQPGCGATDCRVRLCDALAAAGAQVTCAALSGASPTTLAATDSFVSTNGVAVVWSGAGASDGTDAQCGSDVVFPDGQARNTNACPTVDYETALPESEILVDQPNESGCKFCGVVMRTVPDSSQPYFVGELSPPVGQQLSSPSLVHEGKTYELGASLGPMLTSGGGSFAVPLLPSASTTSGGMSGVASFSYLKRPSGSTQDPVSQVDPVPVLR